MKDNMIIKHTRFVDSHVHLDHIQKDRPERIDWLKQEMCLPVSWAFSRRTECEADLRRYLQRQAEAIREINECGLKCFYLSGVHPRNISPDLCPERLQEMILPFLDDPLCIGIGEIGLETGSTHEREVFSSQMEMASEVAQRKKVFGIHTPREKKSEITSRTLSLLESFLPWRDRIVIDHCTDRTIGEVLGLGYWAGVTISPVKASFRDLQEIIKDYPESLDRIMLNTDSGSCYYEDLYLYSCSKESDGSLKQDLTRKNALHFFGIDREEEKLADILRATGP